MDLERGIIKALFYDYPIDRFIGIINGSIKEEHAFIRFIPQILKWTMPAFDIRELEQTIESYSNNWKLLYAGYKETAWPLLYVANMGEKLLAKEKEKPRVQGEQLLRWRMISLPVSEDLLSLSWLAWVEKDSVEVRDNFVWDDTLPLLSKDRESLFGEKGLYDNHAHLGASSDAFNIRWIYWMNHHFGISDDKMNLAGIAGAIRYQLYEICNGRQVADEERCHIIECINNNTLGLTLFDLLYEKIDSARNNSLKPNIGHVEHWDYAISANLTLPAKDLASPYMMLAGERFIIYEFFRQLYLGDERANKISDYFYLYLLIKLHYRKLFIQSNELLGLSNYQCYELKNKQGLDYMGEARKRYAIQTALGEHGQNHLETRISWQWDKKKNISPIPEILLEKSLFGNKVSNRKKLLKKVRLVVSYSKSDFDLNKKQESLHGLIETFNEIISRVAKNHELSDREFSIVGIDFTGSDEKLRPEIYAQLIRYARRNKPSFNHFTYHVGEDFYDLLDGLRSIDEVLRYLKWDRHCRLGHALALATPPSKYYELRGWNVIAPKQVLLDNLVWFMGMRSVAHFRILNTLKTELQEEIETLYREIGYSEPFDFEKYAESMKLRGDHPVGDSMKGDLSLYVETALDDNPNLIPIRNNMALKVLFDEYYANKEIRKNGEELTFWKMPRKIVGGIQHIQKHLIEEIASKGIAIETCPTSNYNIGYFDKYIDLPIMSFLDNFPNNAISINTDDKGVIATSIENEYALMGIAMSKSPNYKKQMSALLKRIHEDAKKSSFKVVVNTKKG